MLCGQFLQNMVWPPRMLSVIRSFHEGMQAGVWIGDVVTGNFKVQNGCVMAPTLFNIYFNAVVAARRN